MSVDRNRKLSALRIDFESTTGEPFNHFYCPILFRDEQTDLCDGHIINKAFYESDRRTIIQRADVDRFFGAFFESEFVVIQEKGKHKPWEILVDRNLAKRLRPKVTLDGAPIPHYLPTGAVPGQHTEVGVELPGRPTARLALKLTPSDTLAGVEGDWQIGVEKDLRLAALVSLLKAAHLTLFELLGYRYALSPGGYFLGYDILGKFFLENAAKPKPEILANGWAHFAQYADLVRPIDAAPEALSGTLADGLLYLCNGSHGPWAFVTIIRTGGLRHAVLVPAFSEPEGAARFDSFLRNGAEPIFAKLARFCGDHWEVAPHGAMLNWPVATFS